MIVRGVLEILGYNQSGTNIYEAKDTVKGYNVRLAPLEAWVGSVVEFLTENKTRSRYRQNLNGDM